MRKMFCSDLTRFSMYWNKKDEYVEQINCYNFRQNSFFVVRLNLNSEKYVSLSVTFQIKIKNGELVLGNNDDTTIMFDVRMLCFIVWLFIATQSTKEVIEPSVFCRQDVSFLSIHCDFDFIFILTLKPYSILWQE